jgi:hypothetical protein
MSAVVQEPEALGKALMSRQAQVVFSQEYSKGELEEMGSHELLDGYAD